MAVFAVANKGVWVGDVSGNVKPKRNIFLHFLNLLNTRLRANVEIRKSLSIIYRYCMNSYIYLKLLS